MVYPTVEHQRDSGYTVIHRGGPDERITVLAGLKPHIFRQGNRWVAFGQSVQPADYYKLSAFVACLNAGV